VRAVLGCLVAIAPLAIGCGDNMAAPAPDAEPVVPGLFLAWSTATPVPGLATPTLRLDSAYVDVQNLWIVGDAGDLKPPSTSIELTWNTTETPGLLAFPSAPLGVYSRIALDLDSKGGTLSYELIGAVELNGTWFDFDVSDTSKLAVMVPVDVVLAAGVRRDATLQIDLGTALGAIDFATCVTTPDGKKVVDTDDEQAPAFRTAITQAFAVTN
jgi:hypothetical protein